MRTRALATLTATLVGALLAGCAGVPAEESAREITPPPGPYQAVVSAAPTTAVPGTLSEKLFLVKDAKLVAVSRQVHVQPTADTLVRDLLAGPTDSERDDGFSSALAGANVITGVRLVDGEAIAEIGSGLTGAGRNDDVLAFAQVVCTLDNRPDIHGVSFTRNGQRIGIPRADGSLTQGPLTVADYTSLIAGM
ncbi:GerMN domain-containing protein [Planosporangium sp. 12N6]|uniref:GerMN domain-containing protein n=1 Tax=Planosporangium spinosum TaxID=3402278 RepID=UPI003CF7579E